MSKLKQCDMLRSSFFDSLLEMDKCGEYSGNLISIKTEEIGRLIVVNWKDFKKWCSPKVIHKIGEDYRAECFINDSKLININKENSKMARVAKAPKSKGKVTKKKAAPKKATKKLAAPGKSVLDLFEEMEETLEEARVDVVKFDDGTALAGKRVRKIMQDLKLLCQEARVLVLAWRDYRAK